MFLKIQPLLQTVIFILGLELIVFRAGLPLLIVVFLLAISAYNGAKLGRNWIFSILPFFFTLSSLALLYLITGRIDKHVFIILAAAIHYLAILGTCRLGAYIGDQTARGMNMAATASAIFFTYASAYGIYLNFFIPIHYLMFAYWLVTLMVSYQYFFLVDRSNRKKIWLYSFLLAFVMTEIVWIMNFWPFGYLTAGVIALILYYVLWDLVQSYFLNILNRKRVVANMIFFPIIIALVLLSAKWLPIV